MDTILGFHQTKSDNLRRLIKNFIKKLTFT